MSIVTEPLFAASVPVVLIVMSPASVDVIAIDVPAVTSAVSATVTAPFAVMPTVVPAESAASSWIRIACPAAVLAVSAIEPAAAVICGLSSGVVDGGVTPLPTVMLPAVVLIVTPPGVAKSPFAVTVASFCTSTLPAAVTLTAFSAVTSAPSTVTVELPSSTTLWSPAVPAVPAVTFVVPVPSARAIALAA